MIIILIFIIMCAERKGDRKEERERKGEGGRERERVSECVCESVYV